MDTAVAIALGADVCFGVLLFFMLRRRAIRFDAEDSIRFFFRSLLFPSLEGRLCQMAWLITIGAILLKQNIGAPDAAAPVVSLAELAAPYLELFAAVIAAILFFGSFSTIRSHDREEAAELARLAG